MIGKVDSEHPGCRRGVMVAGGLVFDNLSGTLNQEMIVANCCRIVITSYATIDYNFVNASISAWAIGAREIELHEHGAFVGSVAVRPRY